MRLTDRSFVFKTPKSISDQVARSLNNGVFHEKGQGEDTKFILFAIQFSEWLQNTKAKFFPQVTLTSEYSTWSNLQKIHIHQTQQLAYLSTAFTSTSPSSTPLQPVECRLHENRNLFWLAPAFPTPPTPSGACQACQFSIEHQVLNEMKCLCMETGGCYGHPRSQKYCQTSYNAQGSSHNKDPPTQNVNSAEVGEPCFGEKKGKGINLN